MRHHIVTNPREATFSALADSTRRAVLDLLRRGSRPAGQIARAFPISRPAISKHLQLLRRARLVRERRQGRLRVYELDARPLKAIDSWLGGYRMFWQSNLTSLKHYIETEGPKEQTRPRKKKSK
jgi:DNA-binding transcriptional ArsR family regulator